MQTIRFRLWVLYGYINMKKKTPTSLMKTIDFIWIDDREEKKTNNFCVNAYILLHWSSFQLNYSLHGVKMLHYKHGRKIVLAIGCVFAFLSFFFRGTLNSFQPFVLLLLLLRLLNVFVFLLLCWNFITDSIKRYTKFSDWNSLSKNILQYWHIAYE